MSSNPLQVLRLNARELLRQPGLQRVVRVVLDAPVLGVDDERVAGPVAVDLAAVSSIDGVVVHGSVSVPWHTMCRRCLVDLDGVAVIAVDELYQDHLSDDEAYPIDGDQIDLAAPVREYVLLELPDAALCRADCAGICAVCGTDRNSGSCDCDTSVRDERWAALDGLEFDDG